MRICIVLLNITVKISQQKFKRLCLYMNVFNVACVDLKATKRIFHGQVNTIISIYMLFFNLLTICRL